MKKRMRRAVRSDAQFEADVRGLAAISDNTKTLYITKLRSMTAAVQYATGSEARPTIEESIARPLQSYAALTSYRIRRPVAAAAGARHVGRQGEGKGNGKGEGKGKGNGKPLGKGKTHRMSPLKPHTLHVTVTAVLAMFKHMPRLERAMPPETRVMWQNIADRTREEALGKYEDLEPTAEQRQAYIPFGRIVEMRETLLRQSQSQTDRPGPQHKRYALLILSLFSLFPPRRSYDWAIAAVLDRGSRADARALARDDIDRVYPNRIVVTPHASRQGTHKAAQGTGAQDVAGAMDVTFTVYKTSVTYGKQTFAVPPELAAIIARDLAAAPRRYLFQQTHTSQPMSNKEFSTLVGKVLRRLFPDVNGRPSISMMRHSYIVAADVGRLTPRVAKELASQMGHSRLQQLTYSYIIDNVDNVDNINVDNDEIDNTGRAGTRAKSGACRLVCS